MYYYIVNGKRFHNIYLAQYESYLSGAPVQFYCNTAEYDKLDWTVDPAESIEELMDQHARRIRDKYDILVFYWSGGTDSQTIYNVFARNKIHIDEIICVGNADLKYMPASQFNWLINNHWDKTTKLSFVDKLDSSIREQFIDSEDWVYKNLGDIRTFTNCVTDPVANIQCEQKYNGRNWAMISGHEKPFLIYKNGQWWSRQKDLPMRQVFGADNRLECFFLEPKILLKQSHLLKQAVSKLPVELYEGTEAEHLFPEGVSGHRGFARSCGRHDELTPGVSALQKQVHTKILSISLDSNGVVDNTNLSTAEPVLQEKFKSHDPLALNYIKGIYNLASDKPFLEYLNAFVAVSPNQLLRTKGVFSKHYCLGK